MILFDHRIPANTIKTAEGHKEVRTFAREEQLPFFYDLGEGICHQVLPEKGHVLPNMLIVGTDSHTTTYGALGAFATGIGATEMAAVWATGEIWLKVPETMRIHLRGKLNSHVSSKDVILHLIGALGADGADYKCVEFVGDTICRMSIASRMVLSNMSIEMGAKAGVCFPDRKTFDWLSQRTDKKWEGNFWEHGAEVDEEVEMDVEGLQPQVACPHQVDNVVNVRKVEGIEDRPGRVRILHQRATRGSCRGRGIAARSQGVPGCPVHRGASIEGGIYRGGGERIARLVGHVRSGHREPRVRTLPGRAPGPSGLRREMYLHHQPELPRTDGLPERRGVSRFPGDGGGERAEGRDNRPPEALRCSVE